MIPKFRAYDSGSLSRMYQPDEVMVGNGNIWIIDEDSVAGEWIVNNDIHLMQSTNLHDKNGKEIFEGDIVKRDGIKRPEVVRFREWIDVDSLGYKEQYIGFYFESEHEGQEWLHSVEPQFNHLYKIIGNIYENPELLEDNK
jgi:uncharacterized phage protein (TIGR01671 family)